MHCAGAFSNCGMLSSDEPHYEHTHVCTVDRRKARLLRMSHTLSYFTDQIAYEKEKYKSLTDEMDQTFSELTGY